MISFSLFLALVPLFSEIISDGLGCHNTRERNAERLTITIYPTKQIKTSPNFIFIYVGDSSNERRSHFWTRFSVEYSVCSSTFRLPREWTYLQGKCPETKSVHLELTLFRKLTKAQYNRSGNRRQ